MGTAESGCPIIPSFNNACVERSFSGLDPELEAANTPVNNPVSDLMELVYTKKQRRK